MLRRFNPLLLVMCCCLTGCMSADLTTATPDGRTWSLGKMPEPSADSNRNESAAELLNEVAHLDHDFLIQQIADARPGSTVAIHTKSKHRCMGTVISASPEVLELMNCICQEIIPGPDGQMQCKTSHAPFQLIAKSDVTHFIRITPALREFSAPDFIGKGSNYTVDSIVFKSGRRMECPLPFERKVLQQGDNAPDKVRAAVEYAEVGSQVAIVDEFNHHFVGTFGSIEADGVQLMNCVYSEDVAGPNGHSQCKTNLVPFQSFSMPSIRFFRVMSPPSRNSASGNGIDSADVCFAEFIFKSGHRQAYGRPPGVAARE